ncbi:MAG: NADH-quinone oxidoreductase subunit J [Anaerolineaceae bacterium]|nr:NADH-quinone oxidoreductase subunit J [Anaerolineaceae bacterium]
MNVVFYLSAAVAVAATILVITRLNVMHALLYLIVSLLAVAVTFFVLGAPFAAALEVIVYAGAIMVLFVFAIMLFNLGPHAVEQERQLIDARMWIGPGILSLILLLEMVYILVSVRAVSLGRIVDPKEVGTALYTTYLLGVELSSVLLLSGLVGAYHLGRRQQDESSLQHTASEDVIQPEEQPQPVIQPADLQEPQRIKQS